MTSLASCAEAIDVIKVNYSVNLKRLNDIIEITKQNDNWVKWIGLLHQVKSFNFILGLTMMHPVLQLIVKVSKLLQSLDINLITLYLA